MSTRPLVLALCATIQALLPAGPAFAQAESEELIEQVEALLGGAGRALDPEALLAAELPRVEAAMGLRALRPIPVRVVGREEAREHILKALEQQLPPARERALDDLFKAVGLLPPDTSLRAEVLELFGAQAAGFYDPAADTMILLDDVPALLQGPVLRHELVHALQDQHHPIEAAIAEAAKDEDAGAGLQALLEGHAVDVMNRATLAAMGVPAGFDPGALDEALAGLFEESGLGDLLGATGVTADPAALGLVPRGAPPALVAQMLFPYTTGATFVAGYRAAHPEDPSCAGLYARPPKSSAEVLDPRRWESGTNVPDFDAPGTIVPGLHLQHSTRLGRLLIGVLLSGRGDPSAGSPEAGQWRPEGRDNHVAIGAGWRGDRVAVYARAPRDPGTGMPGLSTVVWVSEWGSPEEATAVGSSLSRVWNQAEIRVRDRRIEAVIRSAPELREALFDALRRWN